MQKVTLSQASLLVKRKGSDSHTMFPKQQCHEHMGRLEKPPLDDQQQMVQSLTHELEKTNNTNRHF